MHLQGRRAAGWGAGGTIGGRSSPPHLQRRSFNNQSIAFIVLGVIVGIALIGVAITCYLRKRKTVKKYQRASDDDSGDRRQQQSHQLNSTGRHGQPAPSTTPATAAVDRNTSVRSVMTLPAYRQMAGNNEQVLGREGERDGVDVVVDLPTEEDTEALRDQEMEALYQVRLARRQLNAEREERSRQRQEARARNDTSALAQIRASARASNGNQTINELRQNVGQAQEDSRQRSVSTVSYGDLGVARHDGTRLRASSNDSERMGLLSDAASIALEGRSRAHSPSLSSLRHQREQSVGSAASDVDSDFPSPRLTQTHSRTGSQTPGGRAGSSPELVEHEAGPPPEYENVSLDDDDNSNTLARSTTPLDEPPPDYPGPYREGSQRSQDSSRDSPTAADEAADEAGAAPRTPPRSPENPPQLPALRMDSLPEIHVIEPSSAHPKDPTDASHSERES